MRWQGQLWPDEGMLINARPKLLALARDARDRARELLVKAETFHDVDSKQRIREIAAKYVELAERLEQAAVNDR